MMIGILWCYIILDLITSAISRVQEGRHFLKIMNGKVLIGSSPNMIPKQKEMDGIVEQIYEAMKVKAYLNSTLLVLCGDHGMNDAGNHGGSAPGETSPALVFISPALKKISLGSESPALYKENFRYYETVEQSDIAPTLGALLGFPVPRNNLGVLIPDFLKLWTQGKQAIITIFHNLY